MARSKPLTKLVRPLSRGQISLPVEFRRRLKIDSQTILTLTLKGETIEITPLQSVLGQEPLRDYQDDEIARFLKEDKLDSETAAKVRRLLGRKKAA